MLKMKQRRRIYYNAEQRNLMWDRWQKGDSMRVIAGLLTEDIHRFNACFRRLGEYVHGNEVDQDWHLVCRNERRSLAVLWLATLSDR